ncbi:MAG: V-type ATPase subunit [Monoglobales bacterium]
MKEIDYAYAVARIRANESSLLTTADIEQLITAEDYQYALRILEEKGWMNPDDSGDVDSALKKQSNNTWQLLTESSPDLGELDFLIVKNDFHNIKAALKRFISNAFDEDISGNDSFITPSIIVPDEIKNAVFNKKFNELPDFAKDAAIETYHVLIQTADGQLADIMLDSMALNETMAKADKTNNEFIVKMAELMCVTANIKIAVRSARTGKDRQFIERALCQTKSLDKASLIDAAAKGLEELTDYISTTPYSEAVDLIKTSAAALEKWCDDILMSHVENAKYKSFGIEPLIAFYIAKDAEIKNVRIILSCKHNKLPPETIKERVRKLYV